jgi:hypothetical protein
MAELPKRSVFMGKKSILRISMLLVISFVFIALTTLSFAKENSIQSSASIKSFSFDNKYLKVEGSCSLDLIKLLIVKDSKEKWYDVELTNGKFERNVLVNSGNGKYDIYVMLHKGSYEFDKGPHLEMLLEGSTGTFVSKEPAKKLVEAVVVKEVVPEVVPAVVTEIPEVSTIDSSKNTFNNLESLSTSVNSDKFYTLATSITNRSTSDYSKAIRIYQWVSKNIKYDRSKYMRILNNDYTDKYGADVALSTGTGVCYDYASLVVELSKSIGLEAKLVKGNYKLSNGTVIYHAWNEVYISESNKWIKLDTSSASVYGRNYFNSTAFDNNYEKTGEE